MRCVKDSKKLNAESKHVPMKLSCVRAVRCARALDSSYTPSRPTVQSQMFKLTMHVLSSSERARALHPAEPRFKKLSSSLERSGSLVSMRRSSSGVRAGVASVGQALALPDAVMNTSSGCSSGGARDDDDKCDGDSEAAADDDDGDDEMATVAGRCKS